MQFNVTAYEEYSPVYLPVTFATIYLVSFMTATSVIVHTILYEGRSILSAVRRTKIEEDDIHARLMRRYPEVSSYYYMGIFVVGLCMLIGATKVELVPGALLPERPIANMVFKICAIDGLGRSMTFLEALKLGHYLKIPPYASFSGRSSSIQPKIHLLSQDRSSSTRCNRQHDLYPISREERPLCIGSQYLRS
ncbi:hypothetical protein FRC05_004226 [Tulasnella sp. 425]|nr:hypothetical protein FRC05_004226 [Tulasnella sp. 425]